jgi:DNA-binding protein HU-beta
MKKTDLIPVVMSSGDIEVKAQAARIVDSIFDAITAELTKGGEVAIAGFGTFRVAKRAARQGRNPKTGETITIKASIAPKFRAAKQLKEAVQ